MAGKSTFPVNSTIICSKWEFDANLVVGICWSITAYPKGRIVRLWRQLGRCGTKLEWAEEVRTAVYIQNRIGEKVSAHVPKEKRSPISDGS